MPTHVTVWLADGATHRWALPPGRTPDEQLEELRQVIVGGQWFRLPGSTKVYSPYAIVAVDVSDAPPPDAGLARRAGEAVAEVLSPSDTPAS